MNDTLTKAGPKLSKLTEYKIPCLRCGSLLNDIEPGEYGYTACESCGVIYDSADLDRARRPGYYREWLAAFACTCGNVDHYHEPTVVLTTRHRCRAGGVEWMNPN
jgi:DNA-directed RNA polymerase subunit RPC12/RpoP